MRFFLLSIMFLVSSVFAGNETHLIDNFIGTLVGYLSPVLFYPVLGFFPFIVFILFSGGIFFTLYYRLMHLSLFLHAFQVIRGKFDDPEEKGQITHFQALTSALSATVGLGNIAGVAVAIGIGGPGIVFWMWVTAFFGIGLKFTSCTLANLFRRIEKDGVVLGGPMVYIVEAFKLRKWPKIGVGMAILYCIFTIFGGLVAGNFFQVNQTYEILSSQFSFLENHPLLFGLICFVLVGVVIIGGIRRIGEVTSRLVPMMCIFYISICLWIILSNVGNVPSLFISIFQEAFTPNAAFGGFLVVLINGIKRASFSNEAGLGSAAIAHASAKTKEPIREGSVAMLGPFIDTHIICTITALTLLVTGVYLDPSLKGKGTEMTAAAFESVGSIFPILLSIIVGVFAYSTAISWSYYIEKAMHFLFGKKSIPYFRVFYILIFIIGPFVTLKNILAFGDLLLLSMAFPNILACILVAPFVKEQLKDYILRMKKLKQF